MKKDYFVPKVIILVLSIMGLAGYFDVDAQKADDSQYCEMVKLHKQNPSLGWPDFDHKYAKICR